MKGVKTGGRTKGTLNKATADIKAMAQPYGPEALKELARIMRSKDAAESTKVAACRELLDRAYGKAPQHVDGNLNITTHEDALAFLK